MQSFLPFPDPFAFALLVTAAALTPGPTTLLLMASGVQGGMSRSLTLVVSAGGGIALIFVAASLSLAALSRMIDGLLPILRIVGAAFLLYLAWKIVTSAMSPKSDREASLGARDLFIATLANPKAWMMVISVLAGYVRTPASVADIIVTIIAFLALTLPCFSLWALLGDQLRRLTNSPLVMRTYSVALGGLIVASVALIAV